MRRNHIVELQKLNDRNQWEPVMTMHAGINKASGKEYLDGGAIQSQLKLVFDIRYCKAVAEMRLNTQRYRIQYEGGFYKVVDFDDYMERHRNVRLLGVSYHGS